MAKQASNTHTLASILEGANSRDLMMAGMSPEQIRIYRENAMRRAIASGDHARRHNEAQKALEQAIHKGERLTNSALEKLIKNAKDNNKGGIDAGDLLDFTLGNTKVNRKISRQAGLKNSLSPMLLNLYVANIMQAKKHFAGGISPMQVINQSRMIDIHRANKEIFLAATFKRKGNRIYWLTNSGPNSNVDNHKVVVELLEYDAMVIGRSSVPPAASVKKMLEHGKIKFDCDCGRHQYWYRYIATIGKFNFGAHENRYPSTRNHDITGIACKHVLRVMKTLTSPYGVSKVMGYIKDDINDIGNKNKPRLQTAKQIREDAEYLSSPKIAGHRARTIAKKIERELTKAIAQLPPRSESQTYQGLKMIQQNAPAVLTSRQRKMITDYEKKYGGGK